MKRRGKKRKNFPTKYMAMILTAICLVLIFVSFNANLSNGPLKNIAGTIFVPMQKGVNHIGYAISEKIEYIQNLDSVMDENDELKAEINELNDELSSLKLDQYELEDLRALLEVKDTYSDYETTSATVVGKDSGNWFSTFIIDKGTSDGITVDMNVIADGGLVGIVTDVGSNYATVRAIIDDKSNVSASVEI